MFAFAPDPAQPKDEMYRDLVESARALTHGEDDAVANMANVAALIWQYLPDLNWAGFYFARENGELVLGPFQGRPACVRIAPGRGVCGAAAAARRTVLVPDVHEFPGHIACDAASRSEIVVPLLREDGSLLGVLDLDSPQPARFDAEDQDGLERVAAIFVALTGVGFWDLLQKRHAVRRNYPVTAHFRYMFESIGPEIRQYFVETDTEERPFSRQQRAIVYQRAKRESAD